MLSIGIHPVVIFGFLISPSSNSAPGVTDRTVAILPAPRETAPAQHHCGRPSKGSRLQNPQRLLDNADDGTAINLVRLKDRFVYVRPTPRRGDSGRGCVAWLNICGVGRRIERFGNAISPALQHGDGDVLCAS